MSTTTDNRVELRTARMVRGQLGDISDVTLWRRIKNPDLNFPKPTRISGRLYFRSDEIDAWIELQAENDAEAEFCSAGAEEDEAEEAAAEKDGNEEDEDQGAAA